VRFILLSLVSLCYAGCAHAHRYSTAINANGSFGWRLDGGDRCAFRELEPMCVIVVSELDQKLDPTSVVMAGLARRLPSIQNRCDVARRRIDLQVTIAPSECVGCGKGWVGTLHSIAVVMAFPMNGGDPAATARWTDDRGGAVSDVATKAGEAVGEFLQESHATCKSPPNLRLNPSARDKRDDPPGLVRNDRGSAAIR
jgi:hypothetical protein